MIYSRTTLQDISKALDEAAFFYDHVRWYAWSKKGQRAVVKAPGVRGKAHSLLLCISSAGIMFHKLYEGAVTAQRFTEFLSQLPRAGANPGGSLWCSISPRFTTPPTSSNVRSSSRCARLPQSTASPCATCRPTPQSSNLWSCASTSPGVSAPGPPSSCTPALIRRCLASQLGSARQPSTQSTS